MRRRIYQIAVELDQGVYTPSDFCLMGTEMSFKDYNAEAIEKEVTE